MQIESTLMRGGLSQLGGGSRHTLTEEETYLLGRSVRKIKTWLTEDFLSPPEFPFASASVDPPGTASSPAAAVSL